MTEMTEMTKMTEMTEMTEDEYRKALAVLAEMSASDRNKFLDDFLTTLPRDLDFEETSKILKQVESLREYCETVSK